MSCKRCRSGVLERALFLDLNTMTISNEVNTWENKKPGVHMHICSFCGLVEMQATDHALTFLKERKREPVSST